MASANLDLVRSIYAAIERGDYSSAEWAHPQIEYVVADGPDPGSFTGRDGLVDAMRSLFSALGDVRAQAEDYRELDAERVLVRTRLSGRGRTSGVQIGDSGAELFEIQDGMVTRIVAYFDRERAFADLGLAPEDTPLTPAEKLALAERSYAAFSPLDIEALIPLYHPDCEWRMGSWGAAFGTEVFRGHDGVRAWVAALEAGLEDMEVAIDEARVTGEGVLLVRGHGRTRARLTQMELSASAFWQEITFRDHLICGVEQFDEPPCEWDTATPIT
jgi:ketosteroid isomerase-like protein